jgi:Polyketide cyclase / dehydrase and lipid transport
MRRVFLVLLVLAGGRLGYRTLASGALTLDIGIGRRTRPLGPRTWTIAAPRDTVFDVLSAPYQEKTTRALREKVEVWERSPDMVLAAHHTAVAGRVTTTVETVRFDRPERIEFRLVRGPVPHVRESFVLRETAGGTELTWEGELGTDLGALGRWWGVVVARSWELAVSSSVHAATAEAERRSRPK